MADFKSQVGAAIKAARTGQGMTMKSLAEKIGVSSTATISRYESGKLNLSLDLIEKISGGIGVTPQIIFKLSNTIS